MFRFDQVPVGETFSFASTTPAHDRPRYRKITADSYRPLAGDESIEHRATDVALPVMNIGARFDKGHTVIHEMHGAVWCRPDGRAGGPASLEDLALAGYCSARPGTRVAERSVDQYLRLAPIVTRAPNGVLSVCQSYDEADVARYVREAATGQWFVAAERQFPADGPVSAALAKALDEYERDIDAAQAWPRARDVHAACVAQLAEGVPSLEVDLSSMFGDRSHAMGRPGARRSAHARFGS